MKKTPEDYRKLCLAQQTELRQVMQSFQQPDQAIQLFLRQHALLHSAQMAQPETWSFEDDVLSDMREDQMRCLPPGGEHSVAWLVWHMARCEDIAMNLLVAGTAQVLHQGSWLEQMKITFRDTGNAMTIQDVANFSAVVDIQALRAYRLAVGRRTRVIIQQLPPDALKKKVDPLRLQRVRDEGAVLDAASYITDYWGKRNIAGLLLMPATRHNLVHLNEALQLKRKLA